MSSNRPTRSTRGKRTTQLTAAEIAAEQEFWAPILNAQDDEEDDPDYEEEVKENENGDIEDGDDDIEISSDELEDELSSENEDDIEIDKRKDKKAPKKGTKAYVDPKKKKAITKKTTKKTTSKKKKQEDDEDEEEEEENEEEENEEEEEEADKQKSFIKAIEEVNEHGRKKAITKTPLSRKRKSTTTTTTTTSNEGEEEEESETKKSDESTSTVVNTKKILRSSVIALLEKSNEQMREEKERKKRASAQKKPVDRTKDADPTQEELLEEAKITEKINTESLNTMLQREEERKKSLQIKKQTYTGPRVIYRSDKEDTTITFTDESTFPECLQQPSIPVRHDKRQSPKQVCVITGLPAKYIDPISKQPYATAEAYQILKDRARDPSLASTTTLPTNTEEKKTRGSSKRKVIPTVISTSDLPSRY